jgi:hypothetical protein
MMSLAHHKQVGYILKCLDSRLVYKWYNQKKSVREHGGEKKRGEVCFAAMVMLGTHYSRSWSNRNGQK